MIYYIERTAKTESGFTKNSWRPNGMRSTILLNTFCKNRDRGKPRDFPPPTPPGIRVRTTAVR